MCVALGEKWLSYFCEKANSNGMFKEELLFHLKYNLLE